MARVNEPPRHGSAVCRKCEPGNNVQQIKTNNMKANKLVFLHFPCRVVVCESSTTPESTDPETNDLREYASIIPATTATGGIWLTRFEFAGAIEWSKHAAMLTDGQRAQIEREAARYAARYAEETAAAKALQARQRIKYAEKIAKYGEDNA